MGVLFPHRNYNREIETPEFVMPKQIEDFIKVIKEKGKKAAANEFNRIINELKNFEGFIHDSDKKTEENKQRIAGAISEDKDIKELIAELEELTDMLL